MKVTINVNRVPERSEKYIVARICEGELWYWGSWNNRKDAEITAHEIDGMVLERNEYEE